MVSGETKGDQSSHTEYKGEGGGYGKLTTNGWGGEKYLNTTEP